LTIVNKPERVSKIEHAYNNWLQSTFEKVGGPWTIKEISAGVKQYSIVDNAGRQMCVTSDPDLANTFAVIPQIICMYMGITANSEMTEYGKTMHKEAVHGLYGTSYHWVNTQKTQQEKKEPQND